MKKILLSISIITSSLLSQKIDKKISDFVLKVEPTSQILIYTKKDDILGGIYHIRTTKSEFAVSQDFKTIFPTKNSILIENNGRFEQSYIPYDLSQHQNDPIFKIGQGEKNIHLFFNPTCPISNELYIKLYDNKNIQKKYTINFYVFIPTNQDGEHPFLAKQLSNHIQNSDDKAMKYFEIAHDPTNPKYNYLNISNETRDMFNKKILENNALAKVVGAIGTPALYENDSKPFRFSQEDF